MVARTFVDACIIAEVLFSRRASEACRDILESSEGQLCISALTVHIVYYLAEKDHQDMAVVAGLLEPFIILPLDGGAVEMAQKRFGGKDFEDCLQAAVAEREGCDMVITLDQQFARHSGTVLQVRLVQ